MNDKKLVKKDTRITKEQHEKISIICEKKDLKWSKLFREILDIGIKNYK